jgi:hypothetical protein
LFQNNQPQNLSFIYDHQKSRELEKWDACSKISQTI